ncbi:hypothetical protein JCGZ_16481 [Jatropha curcas]|uniref:Uncharacterized protein n=2 Tax=Jatropha curcas TaxID=180498 RepID=A0A067JYW8_JATCU|nr:hypothetical protein JCGZ_16481 [Jatropha curcas]
MRLADSEIYEIDYRGPETHSSVMPPPGRSHGWPFINGAKSSSSSSRGGEGNGDNDKKIHG